MNRITVTENIVVEPSSDAMGLFIYTRYEAGREVFIALDDVPALAAALLAAAAALGDGNGDPAQCPDGNEQTLPADES